jgi:hypothetical protein
MAISIRRKYKRHVRRSDKVMHNEIGGDPPSSPPTHNPHLPSTPQRSTSTLTSSVSLRRSPRLSPPFLSLPPRRSPRLSPRSPCLAAPLKFYKRNEDDEVQWRQLVTYYYRIKIGIPAENKLGRGIGSKDGTGRTVSSSI